MATLLNKVPKKAEQRHTNSNSYPKSREGFDNYFKNFSLYFIYHIDPPPYAEPKVVLMPFLIRVQLAQPQQNASRPDPREQSAAQS